MESNYQNNKITLINFIDTIQRFPDIKHYIFVDADQYKSSQDINWVFPENINVDYLILMTTVLNRSISEKLRYINKIIHIESSSAYKDATDFCICSQVSMLFLYLKMPDRKNIKFTIVSGDHFASNIKSEFENLGQSIYILKHKNRFDLFLISIMKEEQLSLEAINIKRAIISKNYSKINNISSDDLINEIERISNMSNFIPDKIIPDKIIKLSYPKITRNVKLINIRNYLSMKFFINIVDILKHKDILIAKLTQIYPLKDEHRNFFGVKGWYQLFISYKFILEKELNLFIIDVPAGQLVKYITDEHSTCMIHNDELRKYWCFNWNDSLIDFCLYYNIKIQDFSDWITGKSIIDSTCSSSVKKYISDNDIYL